MKIYQFSKDSGNAINNYNSHDSFYTKIMKTVEPTNIGFIYIEAGGVVGLHEAPVPQLFIVIQGEGWISGKDREKLLVKQGEGICWQEGEAHESGSDKGLTALVIQSTQIDLLE
ncbi:MULTISPECIES: cupin domain-containing protein [unclassified Lysinibacillus]|uniref:cupin domain-containing protein n=1 Tax=unclassified Lysinibacillus TaxID=2636778 RepID=UPI0038094695